MSSLLNQILSTAVIARDAR